MDQDSLKGGSSMRCFGYISIRDSTQARLTAIHPRLSCGCGGPFKQVLAMHRKTAGTLRGYPGG